VPRIVRDIVVRAPPERVFEALVDPRQRARWVASMRVEDPGTGPLTVGARMQGRRTAPTSRSTYQMTVRRLETPRLLEMDVERNDAPAGRGGYELEAAPEGTRVRAYAEYELKGMQKLAGPLIAQGMEDELKVDLASLKRFVETP
jgi:uncharacterized protein YndB with AHSA1/START domain